MVHLPEEQASSPEAVELGAAFAQYFSERARVLSSIAKIDDQTLILADIGRKAIAQVKQAARELLDRRLTAGQAEGLAEKLSTGTWTHDYPITPTAAKELGLAVSTDMPKEVMQPMTLYPQPTRVHGGGVEYLPRPREKEARRQSP